MAGRRRRRHSAEFKQEAVKLVTEQGYSVTEATRNPGLHENLLRTWKKKAGAEANDSDLSDDERMELVWLRADNKWLWKERDILKNDGLLREREALRFEFIEQHRGVWPVTLMRYSRRWQSVVLVRRDWFTIRIVAAVASTYETTIARTVWPVEDRQESKQHLRQM